MVIVIMGDVGSGRDCFGRLLANYLGWEFEAVVSLPCDSVARSSLPDVDRTALCAAINSLNYGWRDVILSSPISIDKDQGLQFRHPLVKFVYLTATGKTDDPLRLDRHSEITNPGLPIKRDTMRRPDDRVLTIDSSQQSEQILTTVLSELILK